MSDYVIEKGVPMPARARATEMCHSKYPFRTMEPGDSFLAVRADHPEFNIEKKRVTSAAAAFRARHGVKLHTRSTPEGLRIWRLE